MKPPQSAISPAITQCDTSDVTFKVCKKATVLRFVPHPACLAPHDHYVLSHFECNSTSCQDPLPYCTTKFERYLLITAMTGKRQKETQNNRAGGGGAGGGGLGGYLFNDSTTPSFT